MVIGLSVDENLPGSKISKRFGQANYFLILETETGIYKTIKNEEGHSVKRFQNFSTSGVKAIITGNIGPNSFYTLTERGVKIFIARNMKWEDAVAAFLKGELSELTEPTVKKSISHAGNNQPELQKNNKNLLGNEECKNHNHN